MKKHNFHLGQKPRKRKHNDNDYKEVKLQNEKVPIACVVYKFYSVHFLSYKPLFTL